jgi:hypothetical protein
MFKIVTHPQSQLRKKEKGSMPHVNRPIYLTAYKLQPKTNTT